MDSGTTSAPIASTAFCSTGGVDHDTEALQLSINGFESFFVKDGNQGRLNAARAFMSSEFGCANQRRKTTIKPGQIPELTGEISCSMLWLRLLLVRLRLVGHRHQSVADVFVVAGRVVASS